MAFFSEFSFYQIRIISVDILRLQSMQFCSLYLLLFTDLLYVTRITVDSLMVIYTENEIENSFT